MDNSKRLIFINEMKEQIKPYKKEQVKRFWKMVGVEFVTLAGLFVGFFPLSYLFNLIDKNYFLELIFGIYGLVYLGFIVFLFINPYESDKDFKKYLKSKLRNKLLKTFNLSTMKGSGFSKDILELSELFSKFSDMEYDDVIVGKHNGVEYTVAEANLIARGRKSEYSIFKGVIISVPSNKNIQALTLITTKGDTYIRNYPPAMKIGATLIILSLVIPIIILVAAFLLLIVFSNIINIKDILQTISLMSFSMFLNIFYAVIIMAIILVPYFKKKMQLKDVKTEDIMFDKRFCLYSQDNVEARYLVTPTFMERMKALKTAFGTNSIKCSFNGNRIMFAMSTWCDLFELGGLYSSFDKHIEKFYDEITSVKEMIDHFKLNEKIGL